MFDKDDLNDEDLGFTNYEEIEGICSRHIEEGNDPYNEDEFMNIINWVQEIRAGVTILSMVSMGDVDIVFKNGDKTLFFTLTKSGMEKAKTLTTDMDILSKGVSKLLNFDNGNNKPN